MNAAAGDHVDLGGIGNEPIAPLDPPMVIDKRLGTKQALAVRFGKLAIDGEKTLKVSQNLRTSSASRCSAFSV